MVASELNWTTRAEVASRLLEDLQQVAPGTPRDGRSRLEDPPRARVAGLLALTATPLHRNALLALALDPEEGVVVRRNAIWGLQRISAAISGDDLQALLNAGELYQGRYQAIHQLAVISMARSPGAETVAQEYLLELTASVRAFLLAESSPDEADAPQRLVEWLYRQWLERDRHALNRESRTGSPNRQVIRRTLSRVESRRVLQELWRQASGPARLELLNDLRDEEHEWTFPEPLTPAEEEELAQALALPAAALAARFGRRGLIGLLEKTLSAEHQVLASAGRRDRKISQEAHRRLSVLRHWQDPEVEEWLAGHALGARLHTKLRRHLLGILWRRNRSYATTVLTAALRAGEWKLALPFLEWAARAPRLGDRELFQEAFRPHLPQPCRYLALCGLDRLQETDAPHVLSQVAELSEDADVDPRLRLRALGVRLRRGETEAEQKLAAEAEGHPHLLTRAAAVCVLGEVAPRKHFPILERALRPEQHNPELVSAPVAEEAALALARLATPEAITLLLRAYLHAETHALRNALEDYVGAVVEEPGALARHIEPTEQNWRATHRWPWTDMEAMSDER